MLLPGERCRSEGWKSRTPGPAKVPLSLEPTYLLKLFPTEGWAEGPGGRLL